MLSSPALSLMDSSDLTALIKSYDHEHDPWSVGIWLSHIRHCLKGQFTLLAVVQIFRLLWCLQVSDSKKETSEVEIN